MHRFYVANTSISEGRIAFSSEQRRQLQRVLRMRPGDTVAVFDGSGSEFVTALEADESGSLTGTILETRRPDTEASVHLTLVQGLPKGEKLELVLQKCTELGVSDFVIMATERSVPKVSGGRAEARMERWRAIVREAAEQSGRVRVPEVNGILPFRDALRRVSDTGAVLIAWEQEPETELISALRRLRGETRLALLVGPEGGFTSAEVESAREAGAVPVSLGARILRTETAAIAAGALLIYGLKQASAL